MWSVCLLECLHNKGMPIAPIKTRMRRMFDAIRKTRSPSVL